jgi:flagellar biosynthesis/type III secretory pathway chaperone
MEEKEFLELIELYIKGYEGLIDLSQKVSVALVNRDIKALVDLTDMESVILGELFKRKEDVQIESSLENLEGLSEESQYMIKSRLKYLGDLIMRLNDISRTNSRLLEENLNLVNKYIEIMKEKPSSNNSILEGRG